MTATRTESTAPRSSGGRGGKPTRFARESIAELRKVLWPARNELVTYSLVVIMVSIVAGLDVGFARLVLALFG